MRSLARSRARESERARETILAMSLQFNLSVDLCPRHTLGINQRRDEIHLRLRIACVSARINGEAARRPRSEATAASQPRTHSFLPRGRWRNKPGALCLRGRKTLDL